MSRVLFCHSCGSQIRADVRFCPRCGTEQNVNSERVPEISRETLYTGLDQSAGTIPDIAVILALIFLFPIGLIVMWAGSRWRRTTKIAVTGLLFPPLWSLLLWQLPVPRALRLTAIAALVAANSFWVAHLAGTTAAIVTLIVTLVLGVVWAVSGFQVDGPEDATTSTDGDLRIAIETKLSECDALIADIEEGIALESVPANATERRRYLHALEMRSEGADLLRLARSHRDLVTADTRISGALDELRRSREFRLPMPDSDL